MYLIKKENELKYKYLVVSGIIFKILICSLVIIFGFEYLTVRKFHADAYKIYEGYLYFTGTDIFKIMPFSGFDNTAKLYKILFFNSDIGLNTFFILSSIMYLVLFLIILKSIKVNYNKKAFFLFLIFFIFDSIFLAQPSKDFYSLFINLILLKLFVNESKKNNIISICIIALYAYFFRAYYFITLVLFVLFKATYNMYRKKQIAIYFFCFSVFAYLFYETTLLNEMIFIKQRLYLTIGEFTNTFIKDLIPYGFGEKNLIKFLGNYVVNGIRILFPVELLKTSTVNAFVFIPVQLFFVNILYRYIKVLKQKNISIKYTKDVFNITMYIVAFLLTSFLFEPDFGSVFRHNINLMPFVLYLYFCKSYTELQIKQINSK